MKPSTGADVRLHRNAVRDRPESLSAFVWNACPPSPESALEAPTRQGESGKWVLVVMSVEEQQTAEIIYSGKGQGGFGWSFRTATLAGKRLEFTPNYKGPRWILDWSDANSGSLSLMLEQGNKARQGRAAINTSFSRLDG